ncbi:hypothetical protein [Streptomyces sp. NPDC101132]|uniref:hypothetical protein n=1 Tax=Streptomyces sp. NPDC101132 TaxID=3366110 RepID=UPI003821352C
MPAELPLSPLIAATTQWLTSAFPSARGAFQRSLAEAQARQAVTVAAWLRYPSEFDVQLLALTGPGGAAKLDWITGADAHAHEHGRQAWRTWVDEVVASWAACLLSTPGLAEAAVLTVSGSVHSGPVPADFRRLARPGEDDRRAAALLRHPDLLAPIADLHRAELVDLLGGPRS